MGRKNKEVRSRVRMRKERASKILEISGEKLIKKLNLCSLSLWLKLKVIVEKTWTSSIKNVQVSTPK